MSLNFNDKGLIPAIAQDAETGEVLMLAYMNQEAFQRTLDSGQAWFFSRSRAELWHKGETSGSTLAVERVLVDCDEDALLLQVRPAGPVCHTGERTCFFRQASAEGPKPLEVAPIPDPMPEELFRVIEERKAEMPAGSYVASLFREGLDRIAQKVIEEAGETVIAAKNGQRGPIIAEMADLWFHSLILLSAAGLTPKDVWEELRKRRR